MLASVYTVNPEERLIWDPDYVNLTTVSWKEEILILNLKSLNDGVPAYLLLAQLQP